MSSLKEILSDSFRNNFSIQYAVGQSRQRRDALIQYCIVLTRKYGKIYQSHQSAALVLFRNQKPPLLGNVFSVMRVIIKALRFNTLKVNKREKLVDGIHKLYNLPADAVYLWYIGTREKEQGKGGGTAMLEQIITDWGHRTIYLETSAHRNITWYQRFGFVVYHEERIEDKALFFLARLPSLELI